MLLAIVVGTLARPDRLLACSRGGSAVCQHTFRHNGCIGDKVTLKEVALSLLIAIALLSWDLCWMSWINHHELPQCEPKVLVVLHSPSVLQHLDLPPKQCAGLISRFQCPVTMGNKGQQSVGQLGL